MNYPVVFSKCPVCGSAERFMELETQEEIKKGNLPQDSRIAVMISKTILFNPTDNRVLLFRKEAPVLVGIFDVCIQCGNLYCTEMQKGIAVIEPQVGPRLDDNILPFFGRG